jgi:hypothetical protein
MIKKNFKPQNNLLRQKPRVIYFTYSQQNSCIEPLVTQEQLFHRRLQMREVDKQYWSNVPGMKYITIPDHVYDKEITVLAVLLDGPVALYREEGQVIESN